MKRVSLNRWALLIAAIAISPLYADVVVPGNASGGFGTPVDEVNPFIPAFTLNGPVTQAVAVTITASGCVIDYLEPCVGPNGIPWTELGTTTPMQEAGLVVGYPDNTLDALIAAFVPEPIADDPNFQAIDATNPVCSPGPCIEPSLLFYPMQNQGVLTLTEPGTLYLGINDFAVGDNFGSFTVTVTENDASSTPEPATFGLIGVALVAIVTRRLRS